MEAQMIHGSCLCGGVKFQIARASGPFELCHCPRCRKVSGSAFTATVGVLRKDFELLQGAELIAAYEAPIIRNPPPYRVCFCRRCGSPLPDSAGTSSFMEIPAGLLDDDPQLRPDKHIFVELNAGWFPIQDSLPQLDRQAVAALRSKAASP
jgi:hypothetical protein